MVIITDVLALNKDVYTNSSSKPHRTSTDFKKMDFICNDKRLSGNNKYNKCDTIQCEMIVPRSF